MLLQLGIPGIASDVPAHLTALTYLEYLAIDKSVDDGYDYSTFAVQITFSGQPPFLVPLAENMDNELYDHPKQLLTKWQQEKWDYQKVPSFAIVPLKGVLNPDDFSKCEQFGITIYTELAYRRGFFDSPYYESENELLFCCDYAADCYEGRIFSKDFAYFNCDCCERLICEQSPSNGWNIQYRFMNGGNSMVCLRCFEEKMLETGIAEIIENFPNQPPHGESITMFFHTNSLEESGFEADEEISSVVFGSGRFGGYRDPHEVYRQVYRRVMKLREEGFKCVLNMDDAAIGGMGGSITLWFAPIEIPVVAEPTMAMAA